ASLVLPGAAFGELLKLWDEGEPMLLKLGTAVGLGLSYNVAIWLLTALVWGRPNATERGMELACLVSVLALWACQRLDQEHFLTRPKLGGAKASALLFVALCAMLAAYFSASPYFANLPSVDFTAH